jgi:1-acyl-sn-glycerol-3-phosphate acyltransferase
MTDLSKMMIDRAMRLIARGLAANRLRTVASGLENIPAHGPALIVARHYHHLYDGVALFAVFPRTFHIVVTMDWVQSKPKKLFMESINRLARWPMVLRGETFHRGTEDRHPLFSPHDVLRYQRAAMRQSVELLVEGRVLVIFPEGYPNIDPGYTPKTEPQEFLPFRTGFINIANAAERRLREKVPIIPVGLRYDEEKPWIARIVFGQAIYRDKFSTKPELIEYMERKVRNLSGVDGSSRLKYERSLQNNFIR